jgi:glycosyltransferase involved in cell wall biosynthesis
MVTDWRAKLVDPSRVYLAGHVPPDHVPAYIRSADVVLIPSMSEGLPNVAVEACACGKPVFGSDVGGIPEVVVDGETGLLLPAGEVTDWKDAIAAYARDALKLKAMGNRSRSRMESLFDSRAYPQQMLKLYRLAMQEPLSGGRDDATCQQSPECTLREDTAR